MAPPTLLYFDFRARGEAIRMLYKHAKVEFVDKRISFPEFGEIKTNPDETPNGHLPVLIVDGGKKLVQTAAILRYIANELNLYGENNVERAVIDSLIDTLKEIHDSEIVAVFYTKEEDKPAVLAKLEAKIKQDFKYCELRAKENGIENFFVGKKISVVDVYFVDVIDNINELFPNNKILDQFPLLKKIDAATRKSTNLRAYLVERK